MEKEYLQMQHCFFPLFVPWQFPAELLCIRLHHYVWQLQCNMVLELSVISAVKHSKHFTGQIKKKSQKT